METVRFGAGWDEEWVEWLKVREARLVDDLDAAAKQPRAGR